MNVVCGIWPRPYNQLSEINRNTEGTNLAVTTNKHLWGCLESRRGFLLHINTLDNRDRHRYTHGHTICLLPPIQLFRRLLSSPAYYFDLHKQMPSLPLDFEISRLVCLSEKTKGSQLSPHKGFIKWHHRSSGEEAKLTGACNAIKCHFPVSTIKTFKFLPGFEFYTRSPAGAQLTCDRWTEWILFIHT